MIRSKHRVTWITSGACISAVALLFVVSAAAADVRLPGVFGDHMVLQRGMKIPVWGTASPGERIIVEVGGSHATAVTDGDGRWMLYLRGLKTGGPYTMTVSGGNRVVFSDVMVGEVWLCSGQSNMWWPVGKLFAVPDSLVPSDDDQLRLYSVWSPENELFGEIPVWEPCRVSGLKEFSAVAYFFGRMLRKELGVPVGLIHSSMGGSLPEAWMKRETLEANPLLRPIASFWDSVNTAEPNQREDFGRFLDDVAKKKINVSPFAIRPDNPNISKQLHYYMHTAQVLHDAQLAPLIPYGIRGVIWFQGESSVARAAQYRTLFPAMIGEWRREWGQGSFPFLYVQIANMRNPDVPDRTSSRAELREAQLMTLSVPNTGMAVSCDIGDLANVHFNNKWEVGRRLGLIAMNRVYGRNAPFSGPVYRSMKREDSTVRLRFAHTGGGLRVADGGPLRGFTIAGADRVFREADARIEADGVLVSRSDTPSPTAVRFGWANNPGGNLVNGAGLPASPFRTDYWPGETDGRMWPNSW